MYTFGKRRKNKPIKRKGSQGFPDGLNTIAHGSTLKDTELSELINGIYSQYGTLSKRQGSKIIGQAASEATEINQLTASYKIGGEDRFIRISNNGIPEYCNFGTDTWMPLSGNVPATYTGTNPTFTDGVPTFDTTVITWVVQLQSKIFFANSVNDLVWFDEDGWHVYEPLPDPTTKATVTKTGTGTGTNTFFYAYVDYNEAGHTAVTASLLADPDTDADGQGYKKDMPKYLDENTYLTITLPAAAAGTTKRAIYRGTRQGILFYLDDLSPTETTYVDKGELNTSEFFEAPDENTTAGMHFYLLTTFRGSLVGVSKEYGHDTLCWSGFYENYMSFATPDGASFMSYHKGDGTHINAISPFSASNEDSLMIFKDNRFGKFQFVDAGSESAGIIQDINVSIGSISPFSPHIAGNNMRFWSREGAASVGNEANYGTILRYSVLSIKADQFVKNVTPANIPYVCGTFYNHLSLFGISTDVAGSGNNAILAYDERYNAWSLWLGVYPKVFCKFIHPTTKEEKLYYGSSKDANVLEMFSGKTDYRTSSGTGNKITLSISTKQYDMGLPDQFKTYDKASLVFGTLFGNSTSVGVIRADEYGIHNDPRLRISSDPVLSGFGNDEWGNQEFGMMKEDYGGSKVNIRYIDLKQRDMFWVKLNIQNDGIEDEISLIGIFVYYSDSNKPPSSNMMLTTLA
jgi:hypothetical protein